MGSICAKDVSASNNDIIHDSVVSEKPSTKIESFEGKKIEKSPDESSSSTTSTQPKSLKQSKPTPVEEISITTKSPEIVEKVENVSPEKSVKKLVSCKYPPFIKTTLFAPSKYVDMKPPNDEDEEENAIPFELELEFIYGSSRKGVRGTTLFVNKHNMIVYPAAACVVIYDHKSNTQKIFRKHVDDVKCICMHPNRETFASGEMGKDDMVYVWNSSTLELLSSLKTFKKFKNGGVLGLSFSSCGRKILILGGSKYESELLMYDWESEEILGSTFCGNKIPYACVMNPNSETSAIICCKNEIKFFDFSNGKFDDSRGVISSKGGKLQKFYCVAYHNNFAIVGTKSGSIYVFKENILSSTHAVHKKKICSIKVHNNNFYTSSKDGSVKKYQITSSNDDDFTFKELTSYVFDTAIVEFVILDDDKKIIAWGKNGSFVIYDIESNDKKVIMQSHSGLKIRNELWGIGTCNIHSNIICSCGDDGKVFFWDVKKRICVGKVHRKGKKLRCVSFNPDGKTIAIGTTCGKVLIEERTLSDVDSKTIVTLSCGDEKVSTVKYSPNGRVLAVGSHENHIYVYDVMKNYERISVLKAHTSYVTALDWSRDGKYIRSASGDYELLFWNVERCERELNHSELRDEEWISQNCTIGWSVRGIWQNVKERRLDGTDVNSCCYDAEKKILVTVDDYGLVNLYNYPTLCEIGERRKQYVGHCSHVTNVRINKEANYVFTTGGGDLTVFQWKINEKKK